MHTILQLSFSKYSTQLKCYENLKVYNSSVLVVFWFSINLLLPFFIVVSLSVLAFFIIDIKCLNSHFFFWHYDTNPISVENDTHMHNKSKPTPCIN